MDTIPVGNLIRLVKLTKENALFADSDDGAKTWARCASLIGTCKLNGVNPQAYRPPAIDQDCTFLSSQRDCTATKPRTQHQ